MPLRVPGWIKACWWGTHACACGFGTLVLWCLWLALSIGLIIQGFIATARELPVPKFVLRKVEARLAEAGLRASVGAASFDPSGDVLLRDVQLSLPSLADPIAVAETVFIEVDPWALLIRQFRFDRLRISGGELRVPAMFSASGRDEPLLNHVDVLLVPGAGNGTLQIDQLVAQAGDLRITARGEWPVPLPARRTQESDLLERIAAAYPRMAQHVSNRLASLPLSGSSLALELTRGRIDATVRSPAIDLATLLPAAPAPLQLSDFSAEIGVAINVEGAPSRITAVARASTAQAGTIHASSPELSVQAQRQRDGSWRLRGTDLACGTLAVEGVTLRSAVASGALHRWPLINASFGADWGGTSWSVQGDGDIRERSGALSVQGVITPALLQLAGERSGRNLAALLELRSAPTATGDLFFGPGGRLTRANARVHAGPVIARGVALDEAAGVLHWDGERLQVNDILLRIADSEARGRYEVNPATKDFRFLLGGHLRPQAIDGWFREWWPRFWARFEFVGEPPLADVDIRGRWGDAQRTTVFVAADGSKVKLQGAPFERVRARVLVRPGLVDVLEFIGDRGEKTARGRFARAADPSSPEWTAWQFDVEGNTDLEPAPALFGEVGRAIAEPFGFSSPPRLRVAGELRRPLGSTRIQSTVAISGTAEGNWTFHDFPLQDLIFRAKLQDDVLLVEDLRVGFAGGQATGRVELQGIDQERRLAFDLALNDARLGESIRTVENWSAARRGAAPEPVSRFQQQIAAGILDLSLSAEGTYDDPYSLVGDGSAVITGANLGEINLLGILSALLRRTVFNFTTLELDSAQANFALNRRTLDFSELRVSGPRSAIDASGNYRLDSKQLEFVAKVRPFDQSETLLGSAVGFVFTPLSHALEVKLTGVLEHPDWAFAYGPTSLFRALTGSSSTVKPPHAVPPREPARPPKS